MFIIYIYTANIIYIHIYLIYTGWLKQLTIFCSYDCLFYHDYLLHNIYEYYILLYVIYTGCFIYLKMISYVHLILLTGGRYGGGTTYYWTRAVLKLPFKWRDYQETLLYSWNSSQFRLMLNLCRLCFTLRRDRHNTRR